jgi:hypothetical protein
VYPDAKCMRDHSGYPLWISIRRQVNGGVVRVCTPLQSWLCAPELQWQASGKPGVNDAPHRGGNTQVSEGRSNRHGFPPSSGADQVTEKSQFDTEKPQFITEKCQLLQPPSGGSENERASDRTDGAAGGGGVLGSYGGSLNSLTPAMRTLRAGVPTEYADQRHTGATGSYGGSLNERAAASLNAARYPLFPPP